MANDYDVIIIGSGAGGGTLAYALSDWGKKILLVERGGFLPREKQNWSPEEVFDRARYKTDEIWYDKYDKPFHPGMNYYVGGNTKVYGAALPRFRKEDFGELVHRDGISPAWPVSYEELEPYYAQAEKMYRVHGKLYEDPTDPPRSGDFPYPPISHEPYIQELADKLTAQGLHPYHYHMGLDINEQDRTASKCVRCDTCDGFPCLVDAKSDAHINAVLPALKSGNVSLLTNAYVKKLGTNASGNEISGVEIERFGQTEMVRAPIVVAACGAVNSPVLFLRSANDKHPNGLANSSDLVGRNYMTHHGTVAMAVNPLKRNDVVFQKTIAINDYYLRGPDYDYPLGNIQAVGKLQPGMLTANVPYAPRPVLKQIAQHSCDWWIMSEDLPDPNNRVELNRDGSIKVSVTLNNIETHHRLVETFREHMRRAGYPIFLGKQVGIDFSAHQCGTLRFGHDPKTSVLNEFCRTWDVQNLYVIDASFMPSSAAMNPALTIMAMALRVGDYFKQELN
ncbi:MAG TPA: GMC family oxidoreductase [Anaerolineae bacterium]|nr:GMC family oxidoreductase [Anaerolineae bacterium]